MVQIENSYNHISSTFTVGEYDWECSWENPYCIEISGTPVNDFSYGNLICKKMPVSKNIYILRNKFDMTVAVFAGISENKYEIRFHKPLSNTLRNFTYEGSIYNAFQHVINKIENQIIQHII